MVLVVALMGLPGAGKTPAARLVAARLGAQLISRDSIRAAMFDPQRYTRPEKEAAFDAVLGALEVSLAAARPAVIDGVPFASAAQLDRVASVASRHGARLAPVLLDVPVALARARVAADIAGGRPAADRSPDDVAAIAARFEPAPEGTLVVDARGEAPDVAEAILGGLAA